MSKYNFTKEKLEEVINEVFRNKGPQTERQFGFYSNCSSRGLVRRDFKNLHLCNDFGCVGCSQIRKAFDDELTRLNFKPYVKTP